VSRKESSRFSLVGFAVALVTVGVGTAAGLAYVPAVGTYVGMLAGGLVAGLAVEARPWVESRVAAVLASLGLLVAGALPGTGVVDAIVSLTAVDPVTLAISVVLAFAVGAFGGHFGDDLRDGLTEPLPEPAPAQSNQRVDEASVSGDVEPLTSAEGERSIAEGERTTAEAADDAGESPVERESTEFELEEN